MTRIAIAIAATLVLAGCGGQDQVIPAPSSTHGTQFIPAWRDYIQHATPCDPKTWVDMVVPCESPTIGTGLGRQ